MRRPQSISANEVMPVGAAEYATTLMAVSGKSVPRQAVT
jgi:hypothetical protein